MDKSKILDLIEEVLCDYYEAATDGHVCTTEAQEFMGNRDWADAILFRILNELHTMPTPYVWDYKNGIATEAKCTCTKDGPSGCLIHRPMS